LKKFMNIKVGIALLAATVAVVGTVIGYAYFTSTGTGTGTGTVGTSTPWTVDGGSVVGTLFPDADYSGPDQGVVTGASVTNAAPSGNQNLNQIIATISGVTSAAGTGPACDVTDFQFNSPLLTWDGSGTQTATISPDVDLAPSASYTIADLNVVMVDNLANQDRCQDQTVTVTFDAN
jgi:hypothetical protein